MSRGNESEESKVDERILDENELQEIRQERRNKQKEMRESRCVVIK